MSVYSFGEESPLKFRIPDRLARNYNEAAVEFFKAQQRLNQKFGRKWDPIANPIRPKWTRKQRKAWNEFAKIFGTVIEKEGLFHVNDIMDDFLVRNAASTPAPKNKTFGRVLTVAMFGGVLYGLLSGRKG